MSTLEERIRALEDREAIRELTSRYCQLAVGGRAEEIVALFTREGVMGNEYNKWSTRITPTHKVTLPFTRMLASIDMHGSAYAPQTYD